MRRLQGMRFVALTRIFGLRRVLLGSIALFVIRRILRRRRKLGQTRYAAGG